MMYLLCILLGMTAGAFLGARFARRRTGAPAPVYLDTVEECPDFGRLERGQSVMIGGREFTRV